MARTNGPTAPPAPHWTDAAQGQQGYGQPVYGQGAQPTNTYANQGYGAPAQPQYAPAAPQPGYPQHAQHQPADAYHYPETGYGADSYSQPTLGNGGQQGYPQPPAQPQWGEPPAPSYAPRFEPYSPPTAPPGRAQTQPPQFSPYAQPEPPTQPPPVHHSREPRIVAPERGYAPAPELRGPAYDHQPNWPAEPEFYPQDAAADAGQGYGYPQQGGYQPPPQPSFGAQPDWPSSNGYDQGQLSGYQPQAPSPQHGYQEPGFADPDGYAAPGYAPPPFAPNGYGEGAPGGYAPPAAMQSQALEHEYDPDEVEYEDEGRGRGGRKMMMIAAGLVGVLGIGGAMAFGYSTFFGSGGSTGTPVVKSEAQPSKIKPLDPGGKKFAHTDSKILGRLNDGSSAAPASESDDEGGPRKVTTMVVGRDGSIVPVYGSPPPAQAEAPAASGPVVVTPPRPAPQASTGVPGLTIVDGFGGRGGAMAPVGAGAAAASGGSSSASARPAPVAPVVTTAPPAASAPPVRPQVIARAEPVASPPPAQVAPTKPAARPPVKDPVAKINAIRGDASRVSGDGGTAGAGYVAVLASVPASANSRMDALKQFADLQQRYPSQLQNKTPDVQAADLAGKGSFHRLIVGPPGSRQQASALCSELKTVGYASCWVKAY